MELFRFKTLYYVTLQLSYFYTQNVTYGDECFMIKYYFVLFKNIQIAFRTQNINQVLQLQLLLPFYGRPKLIGNFLLLQM